MDPENEIELRRLVQTVWQRKLVVIVCSALFAMVALIVGLLSPKVYQSRSLVMLPEATKYSRDNDDAKVVTTLLNTSETRSLIAFMGNGNDSTNAAPLAKMASVALDDVRGSSTYFTLTVAVRDDPAAAVAAAQRIIGYLQTQPVVKGRVDGERNAILAYLHQIDGLIAKAERSPAGGTDLDRLWETRYVLQSALARIHTYEFVQAPTLNAAPVGRSVLGRTGLWLVMGFILSAAAVLIHGTMVTGRFLRP